MGGNSSGHVGSDHAVSTQLFTTSSGKHVETFSLHWISAKQVTFFSALTKIF